MNPKNFIIAVAAIICLAGAGCGQEGQEVINSTPVAPVVTDEPAQTVVAFGSEVALTVGDSATFSDGLTVTLILINDSRCPKDVQCIWQGELAPVLRLEGGSLTTQAELTFGTVRGLNQTAGDYAVTLSNVTEDAATAVVTKQTAEVGGDISGCVTGGCSSQLCVDKSQGDVVTDCMFRPEYACYKTAICERQIDGQCGWTQTAELSRCLTNPLQAQ